MKTKTKQSISKPHSQLRTIGKVSCITVALLLLVGQLLLDVLLVRQYYNQPDSTVLTLIEEAVRGLYIDAPIEPQSGMVYFPEAKLRMPAAKDTFTRFMYSYNDAADNSALTVTTSAIINTTSAHMWSAYASSQTQAKKLEAAFEAVPALQSCSRGVQIYLSEQPEKGHPLFTKQVKDGRTLYAYTETACNQGMSSLKESVAAIDSY
ncbi:hypothetical protein JNM87_04230 [Candidatus Saccharibacteria bacterium]|nr:hypothetical protein [Candidatus Saccharibacteria bacterium]